MTCEELQALLADQCLAELTLEERDAVGAHVVSCAACRQTHGLDTQSQALHDGFTGSPLAVSAATFQTEIAGRSRLWVRP